MTAAVAVVTFQMLDLKKLTKQALAAEPGACFACEKTAPDKATLCAACGGEANE